MHISSAFLTAYALSTLLLSASSSLSPIMRATVRVALLLACCVWATIAQAPSQENTSHSNPGETAGVDGTAKIDPINFINKAKDDCVMTISNHKNSTKLRVSCKTKGKSYWCDYLGKPNLCRSYVNSPRHYFTQIMWEMRKLQNSCQGSRTYKPKMCHAATEEAQMSFHASWPKIPKQQPGKAKEGSKPVKNPAHRPVQPQKPGKTTTQKPTETPENWADKLAAEHCWEGVQTICSVFIKWFQ